MKKIISIFSLTLLLVVTNCSDGVKVGQKIESILQKEEITILLIKTESDSGETELMELKVKDITIEDQFLKSGSDYVNLGQVRSFMVNGNKLEVNL